VDMNDMSNAHGRDIHGRQQIMRGHPPPDLADDDEDDEDF